MGNTSKRGVTPYRRLELIKRYKKMLGRPKLSPEFSNQLQRRLLYYGIKTTLGTIPPANENRDISISGARSSDIWTAKKSILQRFRGFLKALWDRVYIGSNKTVKPANIEVYDYVPGPSVSRNFKKGQNV